MSQGPEEGDREGHSRDDADFESDDFVSRPSPLLKLGRTLWGWSPVLALAACAYFLAQSKDDLAYLLRPSTPVFLGQPGSYDFKAAEPGAFARIKGEIHSSGAKYQDGLAHGDIWPLEGAPLLIQRRDFNELRGLVEAEGQLRRDDRLPAQYQPVINAFLRRGQLAPPSPASATTHEWVLVQNHRPHSLDLTNAKLVMLFALGALNLFWLLKPSRRGDV